MRNGLGWTRHSYILLSGFVLSCGLIVYIWWPLVREYLAGIDNRLPWYAHVDWLLVGIFLFMSLTIMSRADLKTDGLIVLVGLCGGLVIESWGTQTNLWQYYTAERPPLWIIPAWPIASLSINRITRLLAWIARRAAQNQSVNRAIQKSLDRSTVWTYRLTFGGFYLLLVGFVAPTLDKSLTIGALSVCAWLLIKPPDQRQMLLVFAAGSLLGYFLEVWGTTRECWIYYTHETPPLFAVLAHGLAAVAFWRTEKFLRSLWQKKVSYRR